jgi:acyl-CoA hydrolase
MKNIYENNMSFSRIESNIRMQPVYSNPYGTVFGGELMKFMEDVAGMAAMKHSGGNVVAARVDELVFHKPVPIGNIVTFIAQVAFAGSSSMQVFVQAVVHDLKDYLKTETALSAFFTIVHVDEMGIPTKIPRLRADTDTEKELYELGKIKYLEIKSKNGSGAKIV